MIYHSLTCQSLVLLPAVHVPHETKATEVTVPVQLLIGNRKRSFYPLRDICYA